MKLELEENQDIDKAIDILKDNNIKACSKASEMESALQQSQVREQDAQ